MLFLCAFLGRRDGYVSVITAWICTDSGNPERYGSVLSGMMPLSTSRMEGVMGMNVFEGCFKAWPVSVQMVFIPIVMFVIYLAGGESLPFLTENMPVVAGIPGLEGHGIYSGLDDIEIGWVDQV